MSEDARRTIVDKLRGRIHSTIRFSLIRTHWFVLRVVRLNWARRGLRWGRMHLASVPSTACFLHLLAVLHSGRQRIGTRPLSASAGASAGASAKDGGGRRVTMLVVTELPRDPRVERAAKALAAAGYRVHIVCPAWQAGDCPPPNWDERISATIIPPRPGFHVFPYLAGPGMLGAAVASEPDVIHCHDLTTCLVGLAAAAKTGARCVCDFHEWYSENVTWSSFRQKYVRHPRYKRALFRWAERLVMRHATRVITVCGSLAEQIQAEFDSPRPLDVVRNIPSVRAGGGASGEAGSDLRQLVGARPEQFVVLYQGGVGPTRDLERIIPGVALVKNALLVLRGPGIEHYAAEYEELAEQYGMKDRLHLLPPVPSERVVAEARSADAGIWSLPNWCPNFYYALPNKVFEYLTAGLPLLTANYPEVRPIVEGFEVGACFDPDSPRSIAAAVRRLADDPALRRRCRENTARALASMDAAGEWQRLVGIYDEITGRAVRKARQAA